MNKHYIEDENIKGVERELIETDRDAGPGDYVFVERIRQECVNVIRKVERKSSFLRDLVLTEEGVSDENYLDNKYDEWRSLEMTNVIRVDGKRYRTTKRDAGVGEEIISTEYTGASRPGNSILTVSEAEYHDGSVQANSDEGNYYFFDTDEGDKYLVVEPLDEAERGCFRFDESFAVTGKQQEGLEEKSKDSGIEEHQSKLLHLFYQDNGLNDLDSRLVMLITLNILGVTVDGVND